MILHRHPDFWKDSEQFVPERFAGNEKVNQFAYIPFGGGGKACVGSHLALMILQVGIAKIYSHYQLQSKVKSVQINPFTTLKPMNEMLVTAKEK